MAPIHCAIAGNGCFGMGGALRPVIQSIHTILTTRLTHWVRTSLPTSPDLILQWVSPKTAKMPALGWSTRISRSAR